MPIHNWGKTSHSHFHSFLHHGWVWQIMKYLNKSALPTGYLAVAEKNVGPYIADVVTTQEDDVESYNSFPSLTPTLVVAAPTFTTVGKCISIYDREKAKIVAVIEIVSPGNKNAREKVDTFVEKSVNYLASGIHYLIIDVLPATRLIDNFVNKILVQIDGGEIHQTKELYAASFQCLDPRLQLYVEEFNVGDVLPKVPVFLQKEYVLVDLEATYSATLEDLPDSVIPNG